MILFNQKNCDTSRKNLGVPDCELFHGRLMGFIAVDPNWSVDVETDVFTIETANGLIQDGTFIPVLGNVEVLNNTPEATTEEYQGGIMNVVRNGLPMFAQKNVKSWAYARALFSMNSFQQYKTLLVFEDGSIAGAISGTTFSGYTTGMINTGTYFHPDGAVSGNSTTTFQLINSNEYNLYTAVLDRSVTGFDANGLLPITDIVITGRADVSEGKVYFKAKFGMNEASNLGGIAIANLRVTVSGVVDAIQVGTLSYLSTTQEWEFEPTATLTTSTPVVVQLYDTVNAVDVAKIGVRFYEGTSASFLPVA